MIARRIFIGAAAGAATRTYVSAAGDTVNRSAYPFLSQNIGTAAANREAVICAVGVGGLNPTATVSGVTVGGASATLAKAQLDGEAHSSIWYISLASGTSADVVVTWTGTRGNTGIIVYNVFTSTATPSVTYSDNGSSPVSVSATFDAGSAAIGLAGWGHSTAVATTWAGLTEDGPTDPLQIESGQAFAITASDEFAAAQSGLTISATPSASTDETLVVAVWGA